MSETRSLKSAFRLLPEDWDAYCAENKMPRFRSSQIQRWLFEQHITDPTQFTNLSKNLQTKLLNDFDWELPTVASRLDSEDGASKLLLKGERQQYFEAVILRYDGRTSLCVSSQVGCKLACSFCQTGKLGFFRHLDASEIVGQLLIANQILKEETRRITHIVFMGMGEPLDNFDNVVRSCQLFTGPAAFGLSRSRVTVSTSGIVSKILPLAEAVRVSLAISLHATRDDLRTELMPINRRFPLADLKSSLMEYQHLTGDKITIEYILLKDNNCGLREAKELVHFLHGLRAKVNLIPFNSHPGVGFERPSAETIRSFQQHLAQRGFPAPVRYSKGLEVSAACGQLAAKQEQELTQLPQRHNVVRVTTPPATS